MLYNIHHFVSHFFPCFFGAGAEYGLVFGQIRSVQSFFYSQPVEFYPCVFPGKFLIRNIGGDLSGKDEKSLSEYVCVSPEALSALSVPVPEKT